MSQKQTNKQKHHATYPSGGNTCIFKMNSTWQQGTVKVSCGTWTCHWPFLWSFTSLVCFFAIFNIPCPSATLLLSHSLVLDLFYTISALACPALTVVCFILLKWHWRQLDVLQKHKYYRPLIIKKWYMYCYWDIQGCGKIINNCKKNKVNKFKTLEQLILNWNHC